MISPPLKNLVAALHNRHTSLSFFLVFISFNVKHFSLISCKYVYIHSWNYQTNKVNTQVSRVFFGLLTLQNALLRALSSPLLTIDAFCNVHEDVKSLSMHHLASHAAFTHLQNRG